MRSSTSFPSRTTHDALECPPGVLRGRLPATILLGIEDITDRRMLEREKDGLLREKDELLQGKGCAV